MPSLSPVPSATQKTKQIYKNLLLVYPNTDVHYIKQASATHFKGSLDKDLINTVIAAFKNVPNLVNEAADGVINFEYEIVEIQKPITSVASLEGGKYWVSPENIADDLANYAPAYKYDSIHVLWNSGPIDTYWGLGGVRINKGTSTYSCLIDRKSVV